MLRIEFTDPKAQLINKNSCKSLGAAFFSLQCSYKQLQSFSSSLTVNKTSRYLLNTKQNPKENSLTCSQPYRNLSSLDIHTEKVINRIFCTQIFQYAISVQVHTFSNLSLKNAVLTFWNPRLGHHSCSPLFLIHYLEHNHYLTGYYRFHGINCYLFTPYFFSTISLT